MRLLRRVGKELFKAEVEESVQKIVTSSGVTRAVAIHEKPNVMAVEIRFPILKLLCCPLFPHEPRQSRTPRDIRIMSNWLLSKLFLFLL